MSEDWLVRGTRGLDFTDIVSALVEVDPALLVRSDASRRHVVITDADDEPMVWIGISRDVAEPAYEATRMGLATGKDLACWTEVTGPSSGASAIAAVAIALAAVVDGRADRLSTAPIAAPSADRPARTGDCPCDIVDGHVGVLLQSRPIVQLTPWIVEALSWAGRAGLTPVVLTPPPTRLSRAVLDFLAGVQGMWVVDHDERFVDGDTGQSLDWVDGRFVPTGEWHSGGEGPAGFVLTVEATTRHAYDADVSIGPFVQSIAQAVGMPAPTCHGGLEPVERAWDASYLTALAADASPDPVTQILQGADVQGQLAVHPQPSWIDEHVTLWASPGACSPRSTASVLDACLEGGARQVILARRPSGANEGVDAVPCPQGDIEVLLVVAALDDIPGVDTRALVAAAGERGDVITSRAGDVFVLHLDGDPDGMARFFDVRDVLVRGSLVH